MKHVQMTPSLYHYMLDVSVREHAVLRRLREATATMDLAIMQIPPEQAQFLQFLVHLSQAKNILELGTFTGYSALAMALALPDDGRVLTCDINPEWTQHCVKFWREAGQDNKIELRLQPALETLHALLHHGGPHQFDVIFIDADKTNYCNYYELALQLVKPQGFIAIDNVFWTGQVTDPQDTSAQTREIKKLNARIQKDNRVFTTLVPIADGLFLIQPLRLS